jgi:hypothetical protein
MDGALLETFVKVMQEEFRTPNALITWLTQYVRDENPHTILGANAAFRDQVISLSTWLESNGKEAKVWQLLADHPPRAGNAVPLMIYFISNATIKPGGSTFPPLPPHRSLFTTERPFANRTNLRALLETFGAAVPGANSVLLIGGERSSGKSYSLRLVRDCAAPNEFHSVDFSTWGSVQIHAWDLAAMMYPPALAEVVADKFDPTKEESVVPRLLSWLKGKLHPGPQRWIVIDHCSRPNLTNAAQSLLYLFAAELANGSLPEVRLVLADLGAMKLPPDLKGRTRADTADLPDRKAVREWCDNLSTYMSKSLTSVELEGYVDEVFAGFQGTPPRMQFAEVLEPRLNEVHAKIAARP